jgi:tetratricopeptide (TPR) repeat protein
MKSGLWILFAVIVVAIIVGIALKNRVGPVEEADEIARLTEIDEIEDSEAKIAAYKVFIAESPESEFKPRAYSMISRELLRAVKDTARFVDFARETIETEDDAESKAYTYYYLYRVELETSVEAASLIGKELLEKPVEVGWIYNAIGYGFADRGEKLDLALAMCDKAIELADNRSDSASYIDSRGWVYYKKGMYEEAVTNLETSVALAEEPSEEVLQHLAYASLGAGDDDKAFDTFKRILVMGEYDYARASIDSLMDVRGYSAGEIAAFDRSLWDARLAAAQPAAAFDLPTLDGESYAFDPAGGTVVIINFLSPT